MFVATNSDGVTVPGVLEFLKWREGGEFLRRIGGIWGEVRPWAVAPALRVAVAVCLAMSVMLLVEVVSMAAVSLAVKLLRRSPERRYRCEPISAGDDPEAASLAFPMVLVQIPMYNEREVGRRRSHCCTASHGKRYCYTDQESVFPREAGGPFTYRLCLGVQNTLVPGLRCLCS
ncbi:hypothetical protein B296_00011698 [Ensete ventricosum]|uniref:Glycosyltransferase 2-like domain-containing protein n=1 Tax=Ensete ventricosum TaxID=4639 RepID=A0A426YZF6_ENSVE|nr:hypothetical protein B296_00011698 [Ensete ventricosum]